MPSREFDLIVRTDDRAEVRGFEAWVGAGCVDGADAAGYAAEESRCTLEGPPETAGGFRPFPFVGACRKGGEAQVLEAAAGLRLRRGTKHAYHDDPDDGAFTSAYLARFQAGLKAA